MKKVRAILAACAVTVGAGTFAVASPAQAALPSCVTWRGSSSPTSGAIFNSCDSGYHVQVVWTAAPDSDCYWVLAHTGQNVWSRYPTAQFDYLRSC
ncbi:hypothetical protein [Actinoplanes sp. NPDC049265]|uniref:hypothetical protein n=1 Tax=Actinoplanes sp. NPDC049265 TaxID=3363902 RepID=UPI003711DAD3